MSERGNSALVRLYQNPSPCTPTVRGGTRHLFVCDNGLCAHDCDNGLCAHDCDNGLCAHDCDNVLNVRCPLSKFDNGLCAHDVERKMDIYIQPDAECKNCINFQTAQGVLNDNIRVYIGEQGAPACSQKCTTFLSDDEKIGLSAAPWALHESSVIHAGDEYRKVQ